MVKIKTYNGNKGHPPVLEDPRTGVDGLYFWGEKVNKQTLAPEFDTRLNAYPKGSTWSEYGFENHIGTKESTDNKQTRSHMMLRKNTINIPYPGGDAGYEYQGAVDMSTSFFVNEDRMHGPFAWDLTSGGNTSVFIQSMIADDTSSITRFGSLQNTQALTDTGTAGNPTDFGDDLRMIFPVGVENGRVVGIAMYHTSGAAYHYPSWNWFSMGAGWPGSYGATTWNGTNAGNGYNWHYIGTGADGKHRFQRTERANLGYVSIWKAEWSGTTPTLTHVLNNNSNPGTGGTHYGGNFNNGKQCTIAVSKYFTDPRDSNKKIWYQPYFDTNSQYHPQLITWDTSSDTFARETDISCNTLSQTQVDYSSYTNLTGQYQYQQIYNETFVSGGNRYISLMSLCVNPTIGASGSPQKIITYGINSSNPKTFTYHSTLDVGELIMGCVWLNDSRTMMGLLLNGSAKIYNWNNTNGWVLTSTIGQHVHGMGRDSLDRIFYCTPSTTYTNQHIDVHMLSPTLPVTITVNPENATYNYGGSVINSYVNVSALNASGARIATSVKLAIEGSSMTFSDDTTVKTVTTSNSGETQVNIKVTGAGFVNINASVVI